MLCALTSMLFLYRAISMSNCLCQQCQTTTVTLRRKYLMIQRLHHCALQQRPLIVTLLSPLVILKLSHKNMLNPRQRLQRSLAITLTRVILLGLLQNTRQVCFVVFICAVYLRIQYQQYALRHVITYIGSCVKHKYFAHAFNFRAMRNARKLTCANINRLNSH